MTIREMQQQSKATQRQACRAYIVARITLRESELRQESAEEIRQAVRESCSMRYTAAARSGRR